MAQTTAPNPPHATVSYTDFQVREKSRTLELLVARSRDDQGEDVRTVKGFFFGDRCSEPIAVHVPAVMDDYPNVETAALRPEVWFSPEVGNDWDAVPMVINWTETSMTELHGTKLSCGFTVFTEDTTVGNTNAPIYQLSNGHPWFGNVLVMRQVDGDEEQVEDIEDDDRQAAKNIVVSIVVNDLIRQREQA